ARRPDPEGIVVLMGGGKALQIVSAIARQGLQPQIPPDQHRIDDGARKACQRPARVQGLFGDAHQMTRSVLIDPMTSLPPRTAGDILYNFHWVVPGEAARAMQAWAGGLKTFLRRRGIKSIINLRGRNDDLSWWKKETAIAKSIGVAHLDAMLDSRKLPTRAMLERLIESFDTAPRPFLLKCSGGQDRTSFAAALYLIHRD